MELNWTPEVIVEIIVSTLILITSVLTYFEPRTKKIKSLFYIRIGMLFMSLFFLFDAFSIIFLNIMLARIYALMIFPATVFFTIGINYIIKESFNSIFLICVFSLGILYSYLAFQPNFVHIKLESGYLSTDLTGLFEFIGDVYQILLGIIIFYWGLRTYLNAPFLIKKEAIIFFTGTIFAAPITLIIYMFYYLFPHLEQFFVIIADSTAGIGTFILIIAILREPKILYILPFTVYRIIVKDRKGYPLFDHDWSKSNINENIFTGFVNAVQLMSEEVMNIGGLLDINLQEGLLILHESESITVGLITSHSSKLLRDSVINFTADFEKKFSKELKESCKDMDKYESAYELIEKYFSNFPFRIVPSKKHPLLLGGEFTKIPLELDNRLKEILGEGEEYELIRAEILKSPIYITSDFLSLYDELQEEINQISDVEQKSLDTKFNNEI